MSPLRAITLALWSNIMGQGSRISTRKQIVNLNCLIIFTRWRWKQYLNCRKKITEPHEIQSLQNLQNGWNAIGNAWVHSCSQGREFDLHWPRLTKPTCNAIKKECRHWNLRIDPIPTQHLDLFSQRCYPPSRGSADMWITWPMQQSSLTPVRHQAHMPTHLLW